MIERYATNGREAVNMVQIAGGTALAAGRKSITREDIEWVVSSGQYSPRPEARIPEKPQVGAVNGLAVYGPNMGILIDVEATAIPTRPGEGRLIITGVMEEEEMGGVGVTMRRKSMARSSVDNVLTVLRKSLALRPQDFDIHVNFPGGIPIDGPSAGVTMVTAIYSAITGIPVNHRCAMTGEVSIRGAVRPVGGIVAKLEAAKEAGVTIALIPEGNWQQIFARERELTVKGVRHIHEVVREALVELPKDPDLRRALELGTQEAMESETSRNLRPVTV